MYLLSYYAEPGKSAGLLLPPMQEKSQEDLLNPYFQRKRIHLHAEKEDPDGLNAKIRRFDAYFAPVYEELGVQVYARRDLPGLSKAVNMLDSLAGDGPEFFRHYKDFKLASLELLAAQVRSKNFVSLVPDSSPDLGNPAYLELFSANFSQVFNRLQTGNSDRQEWQAAIRARSADSLESWLSARLGLTNEQLLALVSLKGLADAYYGGDIPAGPAVQLAGELAASSPDRVIRMIARNLVEQITRLLPGYPAPGFSLPSLGGGSLSLTGLQGRYVYLVFASLQSYTFLREADLLRKLAGAFDSELEIVLVMTDPPDEVKDFFGALPDHMQVLLAGYDHPLLETYRIRAFPTSFLIGPQGEMVLSPAPLPSGHFTERFQELLSSGD